MTEEEIYQNALDDPDNPPRTAEELARMRRVPKPETIRHGLNLNQEEFARQFEISLGTLRDWELGRRHLDRTAISYLTVIEKDPDAVRHALGKAAADSSAAGGERRVKTA
jgi:putative transcriptional regulator